MLHFFPHFAEDVSQYPSAIELHRLGVPHRLFPYGTLRERIAAASLQRFERQHSTEACIQSVVQAIQALMSPGLEAVAA